MKPGRVLLLIAGVFLGLIGAACATGGAILTVGVTTQRDDEGFFSTSEERYETQTAAVTSTEIDLGRPGPDQWWSRRELATVRLRATSSKEAPLFVGIGSEADVEQYLSGVPHDEVDNIGFDPFKVTYRPQNTDGSTRPTAPAEQTFWVAQVSGSSTQTLTWNLEPGRWAIVVMNADGSVGVSADIEVGGKFDLIVAVAVGLLVGGLILLGLAVAMIIAGASAGGRSDPTTGSTMPPPPALPVNYLYDRDAYPVRLEGRLDPALSRWQWLIKWILAIPHFIVLAFLWMAFVVLTLVAFVAILFTGRYPRSIFDFNVGVLRWSWRVQFYATSVIGTDRYPPFSLTASDYPATLEIDYPEHLSRGLVLIKSWLLAFPHLVIVAVLIGTWNLGNNSNSWRVNSGGGLLGLLVVVAGIALLFSGSYPRGLFNILMGLNRWLYRTIAYVALMTDRYPPFHLDQGPDEPHPFQPLPPPVIADQATMRPREFTRQ
jgi:Domain of unknown function (DUF4389)